VAAAWADYDLDGDLDLFVGDNDGASRLLRNDGSSAEPRFIDVTAGALLQCGSVYCAAWADVDGDGDPDLTAADWDNAVAVFRNDQRLGNHWLQVRLRGAGANRFGVGAQVRVTAGGRSRVREVFGGCPTATQPLVACFGLGPEARAETVEVRWPTGTVQTLADVAADQVLVVQEEATQR
jgi:hypothetical protein